ncbi:MAG TPA: DegT/DnrJ/EryC1/StrS family aminotransferase [Chloroflexota bacterium]|nr:DegT/DnrJ/EryC1/StrS family aminotransferase [Chloroflexota bacterium]
MDRIPVAGPWITDREIAYVAAAAAGAWYADHNTYQERFERAFAAHLGRAYAVSLPSCTAGLHLALLSLGVGPGDEVVVPELTWIASAAPISYVGAAPVFADVDERTWCLSPASLERHLSARTRAVILVDLYGNLPDVDAILELTRAKGIAVVEDAAQAIGSTYKGRPAGAFGDVSVFSFHGTKTLTTGEGGMLVTDDEALYRRCLVLRDHGRTAGERLFWNTEVAFKYRMSALQAAMGLGQLERVAELCARKVEIFAWYQELLGDCPTVRLNDPGEHVRSSYWMSTAIFDPALGVTKEDVITDLSAAAIDSRPVFYPLSSLPAYAGRLPDAGRVNPVAYRLSPLGVNLPSPLNLTREQAERVAARVRRLSRRPR